MEKEELKKHGFELFHKASDGFGVNYYQIEESDLNKFINQLQSRQADVSGSLPKCEHKRWRSRLGLGGGMNKICDDCGEHLGKS